ncbi:MAG: type II toxin-antitoxin system VapC family toxin [Pirellulales bacterium]|nr:type II toxin-antitoxin system VapC family toxin [Pirellulales bacterium]
MILVDSNILMYAAGAPHRHKKPSVALLEKVALERVEAFTDVEVFQEILHRYRAIGEWEKGRRAFDLARRVFRMVIPITAEVVDAARDLMDSHAQLSARDALHAAVYQLVGADSICSYDRDFDAVKGLTRVEPEQIS